MIQHADLPETWPALNTLVADDENRLWVSTFTEEADMVEWWVLQDTGELITKFTWPEKPIHRSGKKWICIYTLN